MSEISPQNSQAGPGCCPVHSTSAGPRLALMIFGAGLIVRVTVLMGLECQGKICSSWAYCQDMKTTQTLLRKSFFETF